MSSPDQARRAAVKIAFEGVDITKDMKEYFLSMTYTDNEEDEADDLQIKLQDREGIWLQSWLNDAVKAASGFGGLLHSDGGSGGSGNYTVTAQSGLRVRSGPGTGYSVLGTLPYGTGVTVTEASGEWYKVTYSGKEAYCYGSYLKEGSGTDSSSGSSSSKSGSISTGFAVQAVIVRENWNGDGKDQILDCGAFELDSVDVAGGSSGSVITIKATSLPYSSSVRQTEKTQAWESYYLSGIAREIAARNGLSCMFLSANDPYYARREQIKTSDIQFLSSLAKKAGISLKVTNRIMVLFDQADYESKSSALTIRKGDHSYTSYNLRIGTADTQYQSCRVSYTSPTNGQCIEGVAYIEDYKDSDKNQQLEITAKVSNSAEAKALAQKHLRMHNKYAKTASITLLGNPKVLAGVNADLENFGAFNGKYVVKQATHTVGSSGYTTKVELRCTVEGM